MSSDFDADESFIHVKIKADKRLISSKLPKNSKIDKLSNPNDAFNLPPDGDGENIPF